jgi:hypothetical protein
MHDTDGCICSAAPSFSFGFGGRSEAKGIGIRYYPVNPPDALRANVMSGLLPRGILAPVWDLKWLRYQDVGKSAGGLDRSDSVGTGTSFR